MSAWPIAELFASVDVEWPGEDFDQRLIAAAAALKLLGMRAGVANPEVHRTSMPDRGCTRVFLLAHPDLSKDPACSPIPSPA